MLINILVVAVGGALGSVARLLLASLLNPPLAGSGFPAGTLLVNALGSLAFGTLTAWFLGWANVSEAWRLAVLAGFLGGFTTYSSFAYETFALASRGSLGLAAAYVAATNVLCIGAAWAGYWFVERTRM